MDLIEKDVSLGAKQGAEKLWAGEDLGVNHPQGLNRLRKKARFAHEMPEEHTSAAKADAYPFAPYGTENERKY